MTKQKMTPLPAGFSIEEAVVQLGRRTMRLEGQSRLQDDVVVYMTQAAWGKPVHVRAYVKFCIGNHDPETIKKLRISLGDVFYGQSDLEALKKIFRSELEPNVRCRFVPEVLPEPTLNEEPFSDPILD
jgi:hypothetical protein